MWFCQACPENCEALSWYKATYECKKIKREKNAYAADDSQKVIHLSSDISFNVLQ